MIRIEVYSYGELSHVIYNLISVEVACEKAYREFNSDDAVTRVVVFKDGEIVCEFVD